MNIPNHMKIAIMEIESKLDKNATLVDRLKRAMKEALNHWLVTSEDEQFRCAVGAVLLTASEEEKTKIKAEMSFLRGLSSAISGVPVDFESLLTEMPVNQKPIDLLALWNSVKKEELR